MNLSAVPAALDRTFIRRRLKRSHNQLVGRAAVSPTGCSARGVSAVCASVTPINEVGCSPNMRQQTAALSLAEETLPLAEETLPSVRCFAVSLTGCTPGRISASATPISGLECTPKMRQQILDSLSRRPGCTRRSLSSAVPLTGCALRGISAISASATPIKAAGRISATEPLRGGFLAFLTFLSVMFRRGADRGRDSRLRARNDRAGERSTRRLGTLHTSHCRCQVLLRSFFYNTTNLLGTRYEADRGTSEFLRTILRINSTLVPAREWKAGP
jgi:hypothetical protein